jgi:hypothetical protein
MYPTTVPNNPASRGGYVPYFYEAGLYLRGPQTVPLAATRREDQAYPVYDFSSDLLRPHRPYHPQTVEQVIARGYFAVPRSEAETAIISDRKQTSWLGLDDLISQIRGRYELHDRNIYEMKLAECSVVNSLFSVMADQGSKPADSREVYTVEKQLQKLHQEQREEHVNLWRDVSRLRLSIAELAQLYLSAYRKAYLLESIGGDRQ